MPCPILYNTKDRQNSSSNNTWYSGSVPSLMQLHTKLAVRTRSILGAFYPSFSGDLYIGSGHLLHFRSPDKMEYGLRDCPCGQRLPYITAAARAPQASRPSSILQLKGGAASTSPTSVSPWLSDPIHCLLWTHLGIWGTMDQLDELALLFLQLNLITEVWRRLFMVPINWAALASKRYSFWVLQF